MDYILTVTVVPASTGGIVVAPTGTYVAPGQRKYPAGTVVSLTAQCFVGGGYFDHWEGNLSGSANPASITLNSDKSITAVFYIPPEAPVCYLTTSVIGNGSIYPGSGTFNQGDQIILAALPDAGNAFDYWFGDIDGTTPVPGMPGQLIATMNKDRNISAAFFELPTELRDLTVESSYRDYSLGEALWAGITYKYQGIAQNGTCQVLIGKGAIFTLVHTFPPISFPFEYSEALITKSTSLSITLPLTLTPGQVYSLKVILTTNDGKSVDKAIGSAFRIASDSAPVDPGIGEYRKVKDYAYPYGDTYQGNASEATAEFSIPLAQLPGGDWLSQSIIDAFEDEVTRQGGKMLHLDVYERDEHLLARGYKIVATATLPIADAGYFIVPAAEEQYAMSVRVQWAPTVWALIIIAALGLVAIIISTIVPSVRDVIWGEGGIVENVTGIFGDLPAIVTFSLLVMMMGIMQEQTRELYEKPGAAKRSKPYTEAALKAARGTVALAEKGVETISGEIARIREGKREADEAETGGGKTWSNI